MSLISFFVLSSFLLTSVVVVVVAEDLPVFPDDGVEDNVLVLWRNENGQAATNDAAIQFNCNLRNRRRSSCIRATRRNIRRLRRNQNIQLVEEDFALSIPENDGGEFEITDLGQDSFSGDVLREISNVYGYTMVQADQLGSHSEAAAVEETRVCVIDSGYFLGHTDLPGAANSQCVAGGETTYNPWFNDGTGHGTHVSGTIAMLENGAGGIGINPSCNKFGVIVCRGLSDTGGGTVSSVLDAAENCCIPNTSKVINLSLGTSFYSEIMETVMNQLYEEEQVLIVASAGNNGFGSLRYPAYFSSVMAVGAVDEFQNVPNFSTKNDQVEISAPGVDIYSTIPSDSFGLSSGTSMAAPHVSGVAALVWRYFPECSNKQIREALIESALEKEGGCNVNYGYGIVQARAAYDLILERGCANISEGTGLGGCNQADPPSGSPQPTPSPTPSPTPNPTPSPVSAPTSVCDDDRFGKFFVESLGKDESCVWLAARPSEQNILCVPTHPAYTTCPETCGACTDTCEDTNGVFEYRGTPRNCLWLSLRNNVIDEVCVDTTSGASTVCPETCDICDGEAGDQADPTPAPTLGCVIDGICGPNETCQSCPEDCVKSTLGPQCGNGLCEGGNGENDLNCPQDCFNNCGADTPRGCRPRCQQGGFDCTMREVPEAQTSCCGDGVCGFREGRNNCFVDCCRRSGDVCDRHEQCCSAVCQNGACT